MKLLVTLLAVTSLFAGFPSLLSAQALQPVAFFDASKSEFPESIAIDLRGNLYLSLPSVGRIKKVTPQGVQSDFAEIPGNRVLGLTFDRVGNLVVAATTGVWKVSPSGTARLFSEVPGHMNLNDLTHDLRGNLYVTDSARFLIWKIDPRGNAVIWSQDPLFQPTVGTFPSRIGVNGLGFSRDRKTLHVANTSAGRVLAIDLKRDGSAGPARILAESPLLVGADGLRVDVLDNTYVAANIQNRIARVSRRGEVTVLVEGGLLTSPTSLVLRRNLRADTLFICNNGSFFRPAPANQGLLRFDLERHFFHHDADSVEPELEAN